MSRITFNPFTGTFDFVGKNTSSGGGVATQAPKLIVRYDSDAGTLQTNFVKVNGDNSVTKIVDNSSGEIPNGIFGVCFAKPTAILADVLFIGVLGGYSGLSIGQPVFVSTAGGPTHTPPTTGMVQQIGFAISSTEIFFNFMQAIRRS